MGEISLICCKVSEVPCLKPDADYPGPTPAFHELGKIGTVGRAGEPLAVFRAGLAQVFVAISVLESGEADDAHISLVCDSLARLVDVLQCFLLQLILRPLKERGALRGPPSGLSIYLSLSSHFPRREILLLLPCQLVDGDPPGLELEHRHLAVDLPGHAVDALFETPPFFPHVFGAQ